jgi:hypothetical protein
MPLRVDQLKVAWWIGGLLRGGSETVNIFDCLHYTVYSEYTNTKLYSSTNK